MKVAVSGAAGFLGSHLTRYLLDQGHEVIGIDNLSGGFESNIWPEIKENFLEQTLGEASPDFGLAPYDLEDVEVVYHLAADATEGRSQFTPWRCTRDNLLASNQLFACAAQAGVRRVVFTSSMAVYGDQEPPFVETMPTKPVDIYGVNKTAAERCLQILAETHGFEYVILRPHNVYGPRQNLRDPYRNVVGIFINRMLQTLPIYIYGDGAQRRAFTYIDDITPQIARAGWEAAVVNGTFNIGADAPLSIENLALMVLSGVPYEPFIHYLEDRPREVKYAWSDNSQWWRTLGGQPLPETPLGYGLQQTINWARTIGPQKPVYMDVEIESDKMPATWRDKLL